MRPAAHQGSALIMEPLYWRAGKEADIYMLQVAAAMIPKYVAWEPGNLVLVSRGSALISNLLKVHVGTLSWRQASLLLPVLELLPQLQNLLVGLILCDLILDCPHTCGICQRVLHKQEGQSLALGLRYKLRVLLEQGSDTRVTRHCAIISTRI